MLRGQHGIRPGALHVHPLRLSEGNAEGKRRIPRIGVAREGARCASLNASCNISLLLGVSVHLIGLRPAGNSLDASGRLVMAGGQHCPPIGTGRKTLVSFECGEEDKLLRVEEFETCVYVAEMLTPAACKSRPKGQG